MSGLPRTVWSGHAFGLALHSDVPLAGCPAGPAGAELPLTSLQIASRAAVLRALPADAEPIAWRTTGGRRVADVVAHPEAGYRLPAPGFGTFHVSASGARILAAPNAIADWRWQRYLIGRVLPFAAVLQGLEPLHAGALATPAGALVIAGPSGSGKSTLAAALLLAGLRFLADDVVALRAVDGRVLAHPGAAVLSLRRVAAERLGPGAVRHLGARLGADRIGLRIAVARHDEPLPVSDVILLTDPTSGEPAAPESAPSRLLGATFNALVRDPGRALRQLDVSATLAQTARVHTLPAGAADDPLALVDRVLALVASGPVAA